MNRRAIVLLSGGLDSTTTLAIALEEGLEVHGLSFRYGQRHEAELRAAARVAARYELGERHKYITLDPELFAGSALTSAVGGADELAVPKDRLHDDDAANTIPVTYVPARNTVFLATALAYAEVIVAHDIFIGVNAVDYSGYPDCRPEFIGAFQELARLATRSAITDSESVCIRTPLIEMSKAEIIRRGTELGVDYKLTLSCYDPEDTTDAACGRCDACHFRAAGFKEAELGDPTLYVSDELPS